MGTCRVLGGIATLALAAAASAQQMQIQFAEPIELAATAGTSQFDAYGRSFHVSLQDHERLLQSIPQSQKARLGPPKLLRGRLEDVPGSWVRLSEVGGGVEGALWDGHELYIVTTHRQIARWLALPLDVAPAQTVMFRLSDATDFVIEQYCGTETPLPRSKRVGSGPERNLLDRFRWAVAEFKSAWLTGEAPLELDIALLADTEFQAQFGAEAADHMLARLNIVDGIFAEQVGVLLSPSQVRLMPTDAEPFTTSDPQDLLDQLADYREQDVALRGSGVTHLMTGRFLQENIAGIGYTGALCDPRLSVSLSDSSNGAFLSAIVMAHELGHNFGASHDGAAGGACEGTPHSYLMAPQLGNHTRFSQCSLDAMSPVVARARGVCLSQPSYADVSVALPPSPFTVDTRGTFSLPVTVSNPGNVMATAVVLEVDLPVVLAFETSTAPGSGCGLSGNTVSCTLGDLAPGEQRQIELRLAGTTLGPFDLQARITAANDRIPSNNTARVLLGLESGAELGLSLNVTPQSLHYVGDAVDITVDILSRRAQATAGATLRLNLGGLPIESVTSGVQSCTLDGSDSSRRDCQLTDIPGNGATRVTVRARPNVPGNYDVQIFFSAPNGDTPITLGATTSIEVVPEAQVRTIASAESLRAVVDTLYDVTFRLEATGRQASTAVIFSVDPPSNGTLEAVTSVGATCAVPAAPVSATCVIGDLNPGDARDVLVRVRTTSGGASVLTGRTRYLNGANAEATEAIVAIASLWRVDASVLLGGPLLAAERQTVTGILSFQSLGADPAQNVVLTVDLPAPARITGLTMLAPGFTCNIVTPQRANCSGSFVAGTSPPSGVASFTFVSDVMLEGQVTATITADEDADPANNPYSTPVRVHGQELLTDLQLSVAATAASSIPGSRLHFPPITLTNGAVMARNVRVDIPLPAFAAVDTVSSSAICSGTTTLQCFWSGLLPGETVTIDLYLLSTSAGSFSSQVVAYADNDSTADNNSGTVALSVTVPSSGGGAGTGDGRREKGSGAVELWSLAALALLLGRRASRDIRRISA